MKKRLTIIATTIPLAIIGIVGLLFAALLINEWRPLEVEVSYHNDSITPTQLPDTLTLISWNIGYAGLGDDMDFFYDGGTTTRTSEQRTRTNLDSITGFLRRWADSADFILLQEVDFDSKRSYGINEFDLLSTALPGFKGYTALNYVSPYVPIPLEDPIGRVKSGLVTFSRYEVYDARRLSYPSSFPYPVRFFNLKRCMLSVAIDTPEGFFHINNTHNTAFDNGEMRNLELNFIAKQITYDSLSITAGDWNSTPPGYTASQRELTDPNFRTIPIDAEFFGTENSFAADLSGTPSARFGYEPYIKGKTTTTVIDFALLGSSFELIDVRTVDLGFRNSDHNPVIYRVARRR